MSMLTNLELEELGNFMVPNFKGVFSRDELPARPEREGSYIINLQGANQGDMQGTHWTCFLFSPLANACYYFDSFGMPAPLDVVKFIEGSPHELRLLENHYRLQPKTSKLCGGYCILWLHQLHRVGINNALNLFTSDETKLRLNDERVTRFMDVTRARMNMANLARDASVSAQSFKKSKKDKPAERAGGGELRYELNVYLGDNPIDPYRYIQEKTRLRLEAHLASPLC